VLLSDKTTIGETAEIIEDYLSNTGKIPEVIVSQDGNVVGEIPFSVLIRESNSSKLRNHIHPIKTVPYTSDHGEIITTFTSEPHKKVILLDSDGSIIGVVYSDDVIDFLEESPAASLYSFAGVKEGERPFDSTWSKVSRRYKWLIVNLMTVLMAGGVVAFFENTLTQIVFLAAYLPIVAGMGSNASTQTLAVMVRGISQGEITFKNGRPAIVREVNAGLLNGIFNGVLVAIIAIALGQSPLFGLVVGISLVVSLVVAGFFGAVTPLILRRLGKDPATSAGVLISTATDVIGFITLLGLATLLLL
jgi:magnesium transporter